MKPILLEIEGFNSFEEKQSIDFETLTDFGLFGIFGNTGSGKTSILDAIIYALYADMPRGTKNIVNINCEKAVIRYIFTIKGTNSGKYEIVRSVSKAKTENEMILSPANRNKKVILKKIDESGETVLADSITDANQAIEDVIGIGYQDFIKTVVLPQGQFSQFLKEKNKDRKEMLERIFSLEKYGQILDEKVKNYKQEYILKDKDYTSVLATKKDVDKKTLEESKKEIEKLQSIIVKRQRAKEKLDEIKLKKDSVKETELELKEARENFEKVYEYEDKINLERKVCQKLEKLSAIQETIQIYKNAKDIHKELELKKEQTEKELDENTKKLEELENKKNEIKADINLIPEIKKEIEDISQAICSRKNIIKLNLQISELENIKKQNEEKLENIKKEKEQISETISKLELSIEEMEKEIQNISFNAKYKQEIYDASYEIDFIEKTKDEIYKIEQEENDYKAEIEKRQIKNKQDLEKIKLIDEDLNSEENKSFIYEIFKEKNDANIIYKERLKDLKAYVESKENLEGKNKERKALKENIEKEYKTISKQIENLLEQREENLDKTVINKLRSKLKKGDICPVCKNEYHLDKEDIQDIHIEDLYEDKISKIQEKKSSIIAKQASIDAEIDSIKSQIKEIDDKISDIISQICEKTGKNIDTENFEKILSEEIEENEKYFENYEKHSFENEKKENEKNELLGNIKVYKKEIENLEESIQKNKKEAEEKQDILKEHKNILEKILQSLGEKYEDINTIKKDIFEREKILETKNTSISQYRKQHLQLQKNYENINLDLMDINDKASQNIKQIEKLLSNIEIEKAKIKNKSLLDMQDLEEQINKKTLFVKDTQEKEEKTLKEIENINKIIESLKEKLAISKVKYQSNIEKFKDSGEKLDLFMKNENFKTLDDIFTLNQYYSQLDEKRQIIKRYDDAIKEKMVIKNSKEKSLELRKKELEEVSKNIIYNAEKHEKLDEFLNIQRENLGSMKKTYENDTQTYNQIKELKKQQEENKKILGEIEEIEKSLKGKKFVQFLAKYQLNYVCNQASELLENISSGRYRINIDEVGDFIITDNLNGGISRLPETLSGGETFLVSLALALSLSSQIQLKGNAPLEFFFLDEGFGTLDDQSLNQALEALRKLRVSNSLSIGIISHVKEIKEFVPIKLEVTHPNNSGTKIKMLKS